MLLACADEMTEWLHATFASDVGDGAFPASQRLDCQQQ
jgi:hypothetical protein